MFKTRIQEKLPKISENRLEQINALCRSITLVTDESYGYEFINLLVTRGKRLGMMKRSGPKSHENIKGFIVWEAYNHVAMSGYASIHGLMGASVCGYMEKPHFEAWDKITDLLLAIRKGKLS